LLKIFKILYKFIQYYFKFWRVNKIFSKQFYVSGVKVIWDAGNSVEIIVPPDYKSRTCGLCGNYNNNPEDDLQTKKGLIVTDIDKFTHSWKVWFK
jgi:hypothetical protein